MILTILAGVSFDRNNKLSFERRNNFDTSIYLVVETELTASQRKQFKINCFNPSTVLQRKSLQYYAYPETRKNS